MSVTTAYPTSAAARDRWVVARRGARPALDPWRHQGVLVEREPTRDGTGLASATVFLTGRECPWRCVMCDLWQYTVEHDTPPGAIAAQVSAAVSMWRDASAEVGSTDPGARPAQVKLYNASSFFDPRAVPDEDYDAIALAVRPFARVVVESHPRLVGDRLGRLVDARVRAAGTSAAPGVEVAMGLETVHPDALARLNKRVTVEQFAAAARRAQALGATVRAFVLVGAPFVPLDEQRLWLQRSIDVARDCGVRFVALIPTRGGNGALEALEAQGQFIAPCLSDLEDALVDALERRAAAADWPLVVADTWDLERLATCATCLPSLRARLAAMSLAQRSLPAERCASCAPREGVA